VPLVEDKIITQPFGDRSKVVIEPMLTDQWFVDTAKIVGPALDAVRDGRTTIVPEQHRKVYFHWLENIEPWTISRQLWWGHQIPVWYGFDLAPTGSATTRGRRARRGGDAAASERPDASGGRGPAPLRRRFRRRRGPVRRRAGPVLPTPLNHARVVEVADRTRRRTRWARALRNTRSTRTRRSSSTPSGATPTCSTRGSPPASGPSARWAGPRRRTR
jgi:valyl-tRNA synthetase